MVHLNVLSGHYGWRHVGLDVHRRLHVVLQVTVVILVNCVLRCWRVGPGSFTQSADHDSWHQGLSWDLGLWFLTYKGRDRLVVLDNLVESRWVWNVVWGLNTYFWINPGGQWGLVIFKLVFLSDRKLIRKWVAFYLIVHVQNKIKLKIIGIF